MPKLCIAVYRTSESTIFHWAIVAADTDDLSQTVEAYHIRNSRGPWERGHGPVQLLHSSTFVCCIALPPITAPFIDVKRRIAAQPVEQGTTPLISTYKRWSCEQWVLRTISDLVEQGYLPAAAFHIPHPRWKDLLYVNVTNCAVRGANDRSAGQNINGVQVLSI